jgi:thioredoxin reductase
VINAAESLSKLTRNMEFSIVVLGSAGIEAALTAGRRGRKAAEIAAKPVRERKLRRLSSLIFLQRGISGSIFYRHISSLKLCLNCHERIALLRIAHEN